MKTIYRLTMQRTRLHLGDEPVAWQMTDIFQPQAAAELVRRIIGPSCPREHAIALFLDIKHRVVGYELVGIGGESIVEILPVELIRSLLVAGSSNFILTHNHPSNVADPSDADYQITRRMLEVCKAVGVTMLDHVIVAETTYFSMREKTSLW